MTVPIPPVTGTDWKAWARQTRAFLQRNLSLLGRRDTDSAASQDGVILWDADNAYPVVSDGGEFKQIIVADGYARLLRDSNVTAAAVDTAYAIEMDAPTEANGITLDGTDPTRIVFENGGVYILAFTAQISSSSSSTVTFRFWPRINGTNAPGSTIVAKVHQNDASTVVSRSMVFAITAADYLQIMWATSNTNGTLAAVASTAYAPAAPSVTLSIHRVQA